MKRYTVWITIVFWGLGIICTPAANARDTQVNTPSPKVNPKTGRAVDWDAIETLDMQTAVAVALAGNPDIGAAVERVHQAKARVDQARSMYWPRLDTNVTAARVELSKEVYNENLTTARYFNPNATIDDPEDYYNAGLTASWTLFDGFERKFTNLSARYGEKSGAEALEDVRRLLISAVAQSFFSAQLALENIAIAKADEAFNQRQLTDAKARRRVGTGSLSDVLNFQVRGNQARTTRINEEYQYKTALFGLAALLGLPDARLPDHVELAHLAPETPKELSTPLVAQLIADAMDRRPDIREARWNIKQTEAQIKIAQAGYYPTISVAGSVDGERDHDMHFSRDDFGNSIQVSLSYNLFSGGMTKAKVREARHKKKELEKSLEDRMLSATADIRSSAALVATAQAQVALQRENAGLVQRTRDLVEKEYNAGQASLVRLNEAQKDLTTARGNLALALVGLRQAWIELHTRTGTLLNMYENSR